MTPPVSKTKEENLLSVECLEAGGPDHPGTSSPEDGSRGFGTISVLATSACPVSVPLKLGRLWLPEALQVHHSCPARMASPVPSPPPHSLPLQTGLWKTALTTHRLGAGPRESSVIKVRLRGCSAPEHSEEAPLPPPQHPSQ